MVTASHNPPDYNGMKFVREQSQPDQRRHRPAGHPAHRRGGAVPPRPRASASATRVDIMPDYIEHLLGYVDRAQAEAAQGRGERRQRRRRPGHRQARAAPAVRVHQGAPRAGRHASRTACRTRCSRRNRAPVEALKAHKADVGDRLGRRLRPLLLLRRAAAPSSRATTSSACWPRRSCSASRARASSTTRASPGTRSTSSREYGGKAVHVEVGPRLHQAGDARGRRRLRRRDERASLLPRLLLLRQRHDSLAAGAAADERVSGKSLSELVGERMRAVPGQRRDQPRACPTRRRPSIACWRSIEPLARSHRPHRRPVGMEFDDWRFNLRASNTEPLVRLNVETRGDEPLMRSRTAEILAGHGRRTGLRPRIRGSLTAAGPAHKLRALFQGG